MIGQTIKRLREKKGYSITELAKMADVSKSYLSQIERGLQTNPSLQFLRKVSVPLEKSIDYLLDEVRGKKSVENELDEEWQLLIRQAIADGLKKEDFQEYRKYIQFNNWMKENNEK